VAVPANRPDQRWDRLTNTLTALSSVPFSILVLPQVLQNALAMAAGHAGALSVISWEGYLSSLMGNTLMCSHFANSGELNAVVVQLIGIANNMAILVQVRIVSCVAAYRYKLTWGHKQHATRALQTF
jgi:hypothetical protein